MAGKLRFPAEKHHRSHIMAEEILHPVMQG